MKAKSFILNISLVAALVFSVLYQPVHSLEHLIAEFTTAKCTHIAGNSKFEITHEHTEFDHCFSCEFTLSTFVEPGIIAISPHAKSEPSEESFETIQLFIKDRDAFISLRGPPLSYC